MCSKLCFAVQDHPDRIVYRFIKHDGIFGFTVHELELGFKLVPLKIMQTKRALFQVMLQRKLGREFCTRVS